MTLVSQKQSLKDSLYDIFSTLLSKSGVRAIVGLFDIYDEQVSKDKTFQELACAIEVDFDTNISKNVKMTMTSNCEMSLLNLKNGDEGIIEIIQDASNYLLAINPQPKVLNGDGSGDITLEDGAGSITVLCYTYDGTNLIINAGTYK